MHIILLLWNFLAIVGPLCYAAKSLGLRRDLPPPSPPATIIIPQERWTAAFSVLQFHEEKFLKELTYDQLGMIAQAAQKQMKDENTVAPAKQPTAMGVMVVPEDKKIFIASSVRSSDKQEKGATPLTPEQRQRNRYFYYKKIDPNTPDSVDQALAKIDGPQNERKHQANAACAEFQAIRKYDNFSRPQGQLKFKWPPEESTKFVVWGKNSYLKPCEPKIGAGQDPNCLDYGCKEFLESRGYEINTKEPVTKKSPAELEAYIDSLKFDVLNCEDGGRTQKRSLLCRKMQMKPRPNILSSGGKTKNGKTLTTGQGTLSSNPSLSRASTFGQTTSAKNTKAIQGGALPKKQALAQASPFGGTTSAKNTKERTAVQGKPPAIPAQKATPGVAVNAKGGQVPGRNIPASSGRGALGAVGGSSPRPSMSKRFEVPVIA